MEANVLDHVVEWFILFQYPGYTLKCLNIRVFDICDVFMFFKVVFLQMKFSDGLDAVSSPKHLFYILL